VVLPREADTVQSVLDRVDDRAEVSSLDVRTDIDSP
jgi:hypothetical protein